MKHSFLRLLIASSFLPSTVFAAQSHYYYLAADVGIFQASMNQSYLDQSDAPPQDIAQSVNQQGYTGGVAAGYRQSWHENYFLGGELSANLNTQKASYKSGSATSIFTDSMNILANADLSFEPGINLSESISSYLKLGVSLASIYDTLNTPVGFLATSTNYNTNKYILGFAAGLGVTKSISNTTSIFTEANYHDYGSVSFPGFTNFSANYTHTAHIYSYDAVVGVSYKIA